MEINIPNWLTKEYVQNTLQHGKDYKVTIEEMKINKPVSKGNNYATDIYGVTAEYRRSNDFNKLRKKSLILKVPIKAPIFESMRKSGFVDKEPMMYTKYIPRLKSVLGEDNESDNEGEDEIDEDLFAKSYYSTDGVIILEDLKVRGYQMVDRIKQLDYDHCLVALKSLAKFHAGSVVLFERDPSLVQTVGENLYQALKEFMAGYFRSCYKIMSEKLKARTEFKKLALWFENNHENVLDKIVDEIKVRENEFNVLNHGDFWLTNMLFKYNKDMRLINSILIDLQCCHLGTPAIDFIKFVESSFQESTRNERFNDLVMVYLKELNENLKKYGSPKKLNENEFKQTISRLRYYRVSMCIATLPVVIADENETNYLDLSELDEDTLKNEENNFMEPYFKNENVLMILSKRLLEFEKSGIIDTSIDNTNTRKEKMDIEIPTWLTKEFIQIALENGKDYKVTIEDMKINMPVPKGNNYSTDIYGVKIEYKTSNDLNKLRNKSFIIKVPIEGPMYEMLFNSGFLQKECMVYNEYLPKLREHLIDNNDHDDEDDETDSEKCFTAKSYISSKEYVVILEDLKVKGYRMVDRIKQLDFEHCVVALKALAEFHAASVLIHEKDPQLVERIGKEVLFCEAFKEIYSSIIVSSFEIIVKHFNSNPEFVKYSNWFEENKHNIWDTIVEEVRPKENEFNVLNHGDFWLTNILFKYNNDEQPFKNILIDLQTCRFGSPAIDFVYFIDSSAQEQVRDERINDLITHYIKELNLNLKKYGSTKKLDEVEFNKSITSLTNYRASVVINTLSIVLADPDKTKFMDVKDHSMESLKSTENNPFESYLKNEKFLKTLAKRMEQFKNDGLLKQNKPDPSEQNVEVDVPNWLTKEYIKKALEYGNDFSIAIEDMKINKPIPLGNNFATDIFGIKVEYRIANDSDQIKEKSLIIKVPVIGPLYEIHCKTGFIEKESIFYNEYVPKFKSIVEGNDTSVEDVDREGLNDVLVKSYYSTEKYVVILEDLKVKGYEMVDRVKQLDYEHCVVALKTLSKLHAISVVLFETEPKFVEKVGNEVIFCEGFLPVYSQMLKGTFTIYQKILQNHKTLQKYSHWFEKGEDNLLDVITDEVRVKDNEFNVLNHGDFWCTNMLFKYNSDRKPIAVVPIDFQACRFGSPALDFAYFLEASVQENVRDERFDDLITVYTEELNLNLEKYGSTKRLGQSEFKNAIFARPYFRFLISASFLPMVIADPNEIKLIDLKEDFKSIDDMSDFENSPFKEYFTNKRLLDILSKRMEEFEKHRLVAEEDFKGKKH